MKKIFTKRNAVFLASFLMLLRSKTVYAASSGGGGSLPWETPLQTVMQSMDGPVAYAVSIIGIVAAGATLIWGGEVSEFTRRIVYLVLIIALVALATSVYSSLFSNGAVFF
ncbi:TrbC/VirB2 family protein [Commensalibacter nepenthis]|uniref:TrbC/VirB2 family protein n=1 Tax=Commensalibacter nepenthis TaxID=3043872 RepID=A0ABT6QAF8_9PROT|nr:TrbC/VirB2 family protein [Commensalibacter sp. TBRC 10068]MDI2113892.1 TrbC/VirB2 family protein [Commensalibacter sp. TBRC 10068]